MTRDTVLVCRREKKKTAVPISDTETRTPSTGPKDSICCR